MGKSKESEQCQRDGREDWKYCIISYLHYLLHGSYSQIDLDWLNMGILSSRTASKLFLRNYN